MWPILSIFVSWLKTYLGHAGDHNKYARHMVRKLKFIHIEKATVEVDINTKLMSKYYNIKAQNFSHNQ